MGGAPPQETVGSQCIPPLWPEVLSFSKFEPVELCELLFEVGVNFHPPVPESAC